MNPELKRKKRWFRALKIAECLFEDEGYHTKYLEDLKEFLKGEKMYSPKIKEDLVPKLYKRAKAEGISMTELVDKILRNALNRKKNKRKGVKDEGKN
ncbi:hypothetical protein J7M02_07305 [Candidatus Aerophobetes bacterium]|nr:hypothetical protein [Candidatus Aerophobetes bacterium]